MSVAVVRSGNASTYIYLTGLGGCLSNVPSS